MSKTVIDGNAFYELDEECLKRMNDKKQREQRERKNPVPYRDRTGQKRRS